MFAVAQDDPLSHVWGIPGLPSVQETYVCLNELFKKYYSILNYPTFNNTGWQKKFFLSLLKFRMILIVLAWMNPNMTTKITYHPPMLRRRDWIQKLCLYTKSTILVFNYNIYCWIMDVSIYGTLTTKKKIIKCPLCFLLPLIPTSWCLPYKALAAAIQHIYISTFHCTSFQFGKCPDGNFHHIHWRMAPILGGGIGM